MVGYVFCYKFVPWLGGLWGCSTVRPSSAVGYGTEPCHKQPPKLKSGKYNNKGGICKKNAAQTASETVFI